MSRLTGRVLSVILCCLLVAGAFPPAHAAHVTTAAKVCPGQALPPPPVDTSEVPPPGQPTPKPLPVPDKPVGGPRMGGCLTILPDRSLRPPRQISAASWIIADLDTGDVLAAKAPHARHRPASLIKMLLALVVLQELPPDKIVQARLEDARQECTCIGIRAWQRYPVHKLFTGLLISSGNDAAHTLATAMGGTDVALRKMNDLARKLGALDTRAATVSGLDGPGMMSSAYDLALIYREAMKHPRFVKAVQTTSMRFRWHRRKHPITLYNDNRLLHGPEAYPGFLGGKTGFTDDARHTYVGGAERNGRRLFVVLMRAEVKPLRTYQQARRLLDYGFKLAAAGTEPVGKLVEPQSAEPGEADGGQAAADAAQDRRTEPHSATAGAQSNNTVWLVGLAIIVAALVGGILLRRRPSRSR
ncbi:D-alanyl-D-alanine carboxypeptidase family protein [Thermocrispum sp.]|uniref:D-alanyl-D-alanine carboxypeptidase family protein n=1 Tax=Thermocrispum agreste TaxID=37925 RepID=A0ABD6FBD5_9PSEU|nr:D-alanyl-D-alanine carboxypeptidase family protein [Thermocrispum sp.]